jgi:hypothetical protein
MHYEMELIAGDGRTVGRMPLEPDWQPVIECAAFAAMRRGRLPLRAGAHDGRVEALWEAGDGAPRITGFRVCVDGAEPRAVSLAYLLPDARIAAAQLVAAGALEAGETYSYRVLAGADDPATGAIALEFAVEDVGAVLPVRDAVLADRLAGAERWGPAPAGDEFPVLVSRALLDATAAQARANPDVEVGGVLVGHLLRDRAGGELALEVTAQIAARHTVADATSLTFTAETWAAVDAAVAARGGDLLRCGWAHWHPNWCRRCPLDHQRRCTRALPALSAEDVHLTRVCFPQGHAVALLTSESIHTGLTWSLYGWRDGVLAPRGFEIV